MKTGYPNDFAQPKSLSAPGFSALLFGLGMLFPSVAFTQDFPMRGQTWVFVNGPTEETHIVRSISDFGPTSVIVARFNQDGTADLRYANLAGRFCLSTTEAIDTINIELRKNVLHASHMFGVSSQLFPDTAFSCDAELARLSGTLRYSRYSINGANVLPTRDAASYQWLFDPPECYASRPARAQDKEDKDLCESHWCVDPNPPPDDPFPETCNDTYTECHFVVEESALQTRPSTVSFWNLHLFPKIVVHPRHPATGRVMKEISLSEEQAESFRQQAIDNPDNQDLKPYLNPVLDDSASVYFSGQFLWPALNPDQVWSVSLEIKAAGEGGTGFSHDPPYAYRIASFDDWTGLQKALLLPFARGDVEKEFLENLDTRCPGWAFQDRIIGQEAFEVKEGLDVTLPDVLSMEPTDPRWKQVKQERVPVDGGYEVRTIVEEDRVLSGQMAIVRKVDFPYGDYFWKGCPDLEDSFFKLTRSQVLRVLSQPVPTCNLDNLSKAAAFYRRLEVRFKSTEDAKEKEMAEKRALEAEFQFERTKGKERPTGLVCPDTPVDLLLRRM